MYGIFVARNEAAINQTINYIRLCTQMSTKSYLTDNYTIFVFKQVAKIRNFLFLVLKELNLIKIRSLIDLCFVMSRITKREQLKIEFELDCK